MAERLPAKTPKNKTTIAATAIILFMVVLQALVFFPHLEPASPRNIIKNSS
jgi:hypothetical protein